MWLKITGFLLRSNQYSVFLREEPERRASIVLSAPAAFLARKSLPVRATGYDKCQHPHSKLDKSGFLKLADTGGLRMVMPFLWRIVVWLDGDVHFLFMAQPRKIKAP
jgi:hypothetical protein